MCPARDVRCRCLCALGPATIPQSRAANHRSWKWTYSAASAFVTAVVMTFMFLIIILGATDKLWDWRHSDPAAYMLILTMLAHPFSFPYLLASLVVFSVAPESSAPKFRSTPQASGAKGGL